MNDRELKEKNEEMINTAMNFLKILESAGLIEIKNYDKIRSFIEFSNQMALLEQLKKGEKID